MKKIRLVVIALLLMSVPAMLSAQGKTHRVLLAMTSPEQTDWMMTLGNITNLRKGLLPETAEIEVVVYGPGLAMVKNGSTVMSEIQTLEKAGVNFVACENSMRRMRITKADLIPGVGTTPSGIVEVVRKQEAGWAYVKAGR